jgi:ribosomal protein S11
LANPKSKKKKARVSPEGIAFIKASFNNTIITLSDKKVMQFAGKVLAL